MEREEKHGVVTRLRISRGGRSPYEKEITQKKSPLLLGPISELENKGKRRNRAISGLKAERVGSRRKKKMR